MLQEVLGVEQLLRSCRAHALWQPCTLQLLIYCVHSDLKLELFLQGSPKSRSRRLLTAAVPLCALFWIFLVQDTSSAAAATMLVAG